MSDICPRAEKCPIFTGVLKGKEFTTKSYQEEYCKAGDKGKSNCRRWQVIQKFGKCPPDLLPNSNKTAEEIGKENNLTVGNGQ